MAKRFELKDFSGGLNTEGQNFFMKDNEAVECRNVVFDKQGAIVKRKGYQSVLNTPLGPDPIAGLYIYHENTGERHLLAVSGGNLYEIDSGTGSQSLLKSGLAAERYFSFTSLNQCYIANGTDNLLVYDGEKIEEDPTAPKGKYLLAANNKLYVAGDENNPSRLYYTVLDDNGLLEWWDTSNQNGETFTAALDSWVDLTHSPIQYDSEYIAGFTRGIDYEIDYSLGRIKALNGGSMEGSTEYTISYSYKDGLPHFIDIFDGDPITAITKQQDNIVIFKTNSIYVLYGEDQASYMLKNAQPNIGCIAPLSVVNIYNELYFLYRDGVYKFNGASVKLVSEKVNSKIEEIGDFSKAAGAFYNHNYLLSYPKGGSLNNSRVLAYNTIHKAWSYYTGINASLFNNFDGSQDGKINAGEIYFGDSDNGDIYLYDTGSSDNGAAIDMRYTTKHFDLKKEETVKTFRKILISVISEGNVNLEYSIDKGLKSGNFEIVGYESKEEYKWGEVSWAELIWYSPAVVRFGASFPGGMHGSTISFTIRDNSTKSVQFFGLTMQLRDKRESYWR